MIPLDEEQQALLELVRDIAAKEIAPRAAPDEEAAAFPRDLLDLLGRLDLMGLPFDPDLGGGGQPGPVYLSVVEELAKAFLAVGLGLSVHTLSTWAVATYGSEQLRAEVVPRMTAGEWLGAYALSEPGSGSDAAGLVTRARRDGDHYVVDGTKAWVTHGGHADAYVLIARTGEHKTRGISALLVPGRLDGLSFGAPEKKMGMRSSPTAQLVFEGARVPAANLLAAEGEGFKIALSALDGGRLGIAACATGVGQAAVDQAVAYARERRQFGQPIGSFQGVAFLLADMATAVEARPRPLAVRGAAPARRGAVLPPGRDGQAGRHRCRDEGHHRRDPDLRWLRLHPGVPRRAPLPRGQGPADRRGHQPGPAARDLPRLARMSGFQRARARRAGNA